MYTAQSLRGRSQRSLYFEKVLDGLQDDAKLGWPEVRRKELVQGVRHVRFTG